MKEGVVRRWINKALPVLAERLPDVTTLEFETLLCNLLDDDGRRAILSGFLKIRNMNIEYCHFETSEQLNRFIASFPSLVCCSTSYWDFRMMTLERPLFHKVYNPSPWILANPSFSIKC